ncbi:mitochondrial metalloendopeptidase OMA1 [Forsythia ovata]|uniref:Mitochondrial metalloendopeptidase OMA1 n=1 Tax=Forsythia ovata TaxID=205694 RepID=A0ABD1X5X9_9LAMI
MALICCPLWAGVFGPPTDTSAGGPNTLAHKGQEMSPDLGFYFPPMIIAHLLKSNSPPPPLAVNFQFPIISATKEERLRSLIHWTIRLYLTQKEPILCFCQKNLENELGETLFKQKKASFRGKLLPPLHPESIRVPLHPESIRVQRIVHHIIEALQRGLGKEKVWSDISYSPESVGLPRETSSWETLMGLNDKIADEEKWLKEEKWQKEDEILDDHWV